MTIKLHQEILPFTKHVCHNNPEHMCVEDDSMAQTEAISFMDSKSVFKMRNRVTNTCLISAGLMVSVVRAVATKSIILYQTAVSINARLVIIRLLSLPGLFFMTHARFAPLARTAVTAILAALPFSMTNLPFSIPTLL